MVVGLTGKACSGKNVVCDMLFRMARWRCIDVDKLGWPVLEESKKELVALFGPGCVTPLGKVDHKVIREAVFKDSTLRTALEQITHPRIVQMCHRLTEEAEKEGEKVVVWNAPLLQRARLDEECDVVIFVDASPAVRFQRARWRDGMDFSQFQRREESQRDIDFHTISPRAKLLVIENNGDEMSLHRQVAKCCAKIALLRKGF